MHKFKIFTTVAICALGLSGCGGSGSSGSTNTSPPPPIDNTSPSVSFSPTNLTVESGMTGSSTLTATDNVGVTTGPNVTCTNGGSFDVSSNIFTAAEVTAEITSVCTATAHDAAGNEGSATLTVTMTPLPDNVVPVVTFSPMSLTINGGEAGFSTLSAIDDVDGTIVPIVRCENDASFDTALGRFVGPPVTSDTTIVCTATARDEAGNEGSGTLTVTILAINNPPNNPPTASANANLTIVMEGQPFTLDASASSDADGDELTFNWAQVSGTSVTIDDPTLAVQDLTAPELTEDETLTFEVTASDGEDTDQAIISVMVEALRPPALTISQSTPFNPEALRKIYDITANEDGSYKVHWSIFSTNTSNRAVSSQDFTSHGITSGNQTDGEFQTGSVFLGVEPLQVVLSGDTVFNILDHDNGDQFVVQDGFSHYRDIVSGTILSAGDVFAPEGDMQEAVAIGTNQVVSVATAIVGEGNFRVKAFILQPDGTSIGTVLLPTGVGRVRDAAVAAFIDDTYVAIWEQDVAGNSDSITEVIMQRGTTDGNLLGNSIVVNEEQTLIGTTPSVATMQNGQALVAWTNRGGDSSGLSIKGRVINTDGSFASSEFLINSTTNGDQSNPTVIPLNTNQVFVTWADDNIGFNSRQIRGQVVNADGTLYGNEFLIAPNPQFNFNGEIEFTTLPDGRVILGWVIPSVPVESFTLGLYPVGKQ